MKKNKRKKITCSKCGYIRWGLINKRCPKCGYIETDKLMHLLGNCIVIGEGGIK